MLPFPHLPETQLATQTRGVSREISPEIVGPMKGGISPYLGHSPGENAGNGYRAALHVFTIKHEENQYLGPGHTIGSSLSKWGILAQMASTYTH
jgi:hypothetical protein